MIDLNTICQDHWYNDSMASEDIKQEIEREPYVPLRLHLASGKVMDVPYPGSAFLRQNTLVIMHRLAAHPGNRGL